MLRCTPFFLFDGTCAEAMTFTKSVLTETYADKAWRYSNERSVSDRKAQ